jgi:hypothetical protein
MNLVKEQYGVRIYASLIHAQSSSALAAFDVPTTKILATGSVTRSHRSRAAVGGSANTSPERSNIEQAAENRMTSQPVLSHGSAGDIGDYALGALATSPRRRRCGSSN